MSFEYDSDVEFDQFEKPGFDMKFFSIENLISYVPLEYDEYSINSSDYIENLQLDQNILCTFGKITNREQKQAILEWMEAMNIILSNDGNSIESLLQKYSYNYKVKLVNDQPITDETKKFKPQEFLAFLFNKILVPALPGSGVSDWFKSSIYENYKLDMKNCHDDYKHSLKCIDDSIVSFKVQRWQNHRANMIKKILASLGKSLKADDDKKQIKKDKFSLKADITDDETFYPEYWFAYVERYSKTIFTDDINYQYFLKILGIIFDCGYKPENLNSLAQITLSDRETARILLEQLGNFYQTIMNDKKKIETLVQSKVFEINEAYHKSQLGTYLQSKTLREFWIEFLENHCEKYLKGIKYSEYITYWYNEDIQSYINHDDHFIKSIIQTILFCIKNIIEMKSNEFLKILQKYFSDEIIKVEGLKEINLNSIQASLVKYLNDKLKDLIPAKHLNIFLKKIKEIFTNLSLNIELKSDLEIQIHKLLSTYIQYLLLKLRSAWIVTFKEKLKKLNEDNFADEVIPLLKNDLKNFMDKDSSDKVFKHLKIFITDSEKDDNLNDLNEDQQTIYLQIKNVINENLEIFKKNKRITMRNKIRDKILKTNLNLYRKSFDEMIKDNGNVHDFLEVYWKNFLDETLNKYLSDKDYNYVTVNFTSLLNKSLKVDIADYDDQIFIQDLIESLQKLIEICKIHWRKRMLIEIRNVKKQFLAENIQSFIDIHGFKPEKNSTLIEFWDYYFKEYPSFLLENHSKNPLYFSCLTNYWKNRKMSDYKQYFVDAKDDGKENANQIFDNSIDRDFCDKAFKIIIESLEHDEKRRLAEIQEIFSGINYSSNYDFESHVTGINHESNLLYEKYVLLIRKYLNEKVKPMVREDEFKILYENVNFIIKSLKRDKVPEYKPQSEQEYVADFLKSIYNYVQSIIFQVLEKTQDDQIEKLTEYVNDLITKLISSNQFSWPCNEIKTHLTLGYYNNLLNEDERKLYDDFLKKLENENDNYLPDERGYFYEICEAIQNARVDFKNSKDDHFSGMYDDQMQTFMSGMVGKNFDELKTYMMKSGFNYDDNKSFGDNYSNFMRYYFTQNYKSALNDSDNDKFVSNFNRWVSGIDYSIDDLDLDNKNFVHKYITSTRGIIYDIKTKQRRDRTNEIDNLRHRDDFRKFKWSGFNYEGSSLFNIWKNYFDNNLSNVFEDGYNKYWEYLVEYWKTRDLKKYSENMEKIPDADRDFCKQLFARIISSLEEEEKNNFRNLENELEKIKRVIIKRNPEEIKKFFEIEEDIESELFKQLKKKAYDFYDSHLTKVLRDGDERWSIRIMSVLDIQNNNPTDVGDNNDVYQNFKNNIVRGFKSIADETLDYVRELILTRMNKEKDESIDKFRKDHNTKETFPANVSTDYLSSLVLLVYQDKRDEFEKEISDLLKNRTENYNRKNSIDKQDKFMDDVYQLITGYFKLIAVMKSTRDATEKLKQSFTLFLKNLSLTSIQQYLDDLKFLGYSVKLANKKVVVEKSNPPTESLGPNDYSEIHVRMEIIAHFIKAKLIQFDETNLLKDDYYNLLDQIIRLFEKKSHHKECKFQNDLSKEILAEVKNVYEEKIKLYREQSLNDLDDLIRNLQTAENYITNFDSTTICNSFKTKLVWWDDKLDNQEINLIWSSYCSQIISVGFFEKNLTERYFRELTSASSNSRKSSVGLIISSVAGQNEDREYWETVKEKILDQIKQYQLFRDWTNIKTEFQSIVKDNKDNSYKIMKKTLEDFLDKKKNHFKEMNIFKKLISLKFNENDVNNFFGSKKVTQYEKDFYHTFDEFWNGYLSTIRATEGDEFDKKLKSCKTWEVTNVEGSVQYKFNDVIRFIHERIIELLQDNSKQEFTEEIKRILSEDTDQPSLKDEDKDKNEKEFIYQILHKCWEFRLSYSMFTKYREGMTNLNNLRKLCDQFKKHELTQFYNVFIKHSQSGSVNMKDLIANYLLDYYTKHIRKYFWSESTREYIDNNFSLVINNQGKIDDRQDKDFFDRFQIVINRSVITLCSCYEDLVINAIKSLVPLNKQGILKFKNNFELKLANDNKNKELENFMKSFYDKYTCLVFSDKNNAQKYFNVVSEYDQEKDIHDHLKEAVGKYCQEVDETFCSSIFEMYLVIITKHLNDNMTNIADSFNELFVISYKSDSFSYDDFSRVCKTVKSSILDKFNGNDQLKSKSEPGKFESALNAIFEGRTSHSFSDSVLSLLINNIATWKNTYFQLMHEIFMRGFLQKVSDIKKKNNNQWKGEDIWKYLENSKVLSSLYHLTDNEVQILKQWINNPTNQTFNTSNENFNVIFSSLKFYADDLTEKKETYSYKCDENIEANMKKLGLEYNAYDSNTANCIMYFARLADHNHKDIIEENKKFLMENFFAFLTMPEYNYTILLDSIPKVDGNEAIINNLIQKLRSGIQSIWEKEKALNSNDLQRELLLCQDINYFNSKRKEYCTMLKVDDMDKFEVCKNTFYFVFNKYLFRPNLRDVYFKILIENDSPFSVNKAINEIENSDDKSLCSRLFPLMRNYIHNQEQSSDFRELYDIFNALSGKDMEEKKKLYKLYGADHLCIEKHKLRQIFDMYLSKFYSEEKDMEADTRSILDNILDEEEIKDFKTFEKLSHELQQNLNQIKRFFKMLSSEEMLYNKLKLFEAFLIGLGENEEKERIRDYCKTHIERHLTDTSFKNDYKALLNDQDFKTLIGDGNERGKNHERILKRISVHLARVKKAGFSNDLEVFRRNVNQITCTHLRNDIKQFTNKLIEESDSLIDKHFTHETMSKIKNAVRDLIEQDKRIVTEDFDGSYSSIIFSMKKILKFALRQKYKVECLNKMNSLLNEMKDKEKFKSTLASLGITEEMISSSCKIEFDKFLEKIYSDHVERCVYGKSDKELVSAAFSNFAENFHMLSKTSREEEEFCQELKALGQKFLIKFIEFTGDQSVLLDRNKTEDSHLILSCIFEDLLSVVTMDNFVSCIKYNRYIQIFMKSDDYNAAITNLEDTSIEIEKKIEASRAFVTKLLQELVKFYSNLSDDKGNLLFSQLETLFNKIEPKTTESFNRTIDQFGFEYQKLNGIKIAAHHKKTLKLFFEFIVRYFADPVRIFGSFSSCNDVIVLMLNHYLKQCSRCDTTDRVREVSKKYNIKKIDNLLQLTKYFLNLQFNKDTSSLMFYASNTKSKDDILENKSANLKYLLNEAMKSIDKHLRCFKF